MPNKEKTMVLMTLAALKSRKIYILDNIVKNTECKMEVIELAAKLKERGALIIDCVDELGNSMWTEPDRFYTYAYRDSKYKLYAKSHE